MYISRLDNERRIHVAVMEMEKELVYMKLETDCQPVTYYRAGLTYRVAMWGMFAAQRMRLLWI